MYKFQFQIPVGSIGEVLQRLANAEKAIDPYNDENSSFSLTLPKEFDGPATIIWNTRQNHIAKDIISRMGYKYTLGLH